MNQSTGKFLMVLGIIILLAGVLIYFAGNRLNFLGKVPGDIKIERKNFTFHFPIVTCLIISVILTLVVKIIQWFSK